MSFTKDHLYFDDVTEGQEWQSLGRTVTAADIVNFAGISGDFSPIHMDHEFVKTTAFRRPIAHGLLVWSLSTGLALSAPPMRTQAFLKVREWSFVEPVFIGDTIHVVTTVLGKEERARGRRGQITWHKAIVNQAGKVVQEGSTVTLVEGRANLPKGEVSKSGIPDTGEDAV